MNYKKFSSPTLPQLLSMNKSSVEGLSYALQHNVKEDSDFGGHALQVVYLLLEYIAKNMNDGDTIVDIIKTNVDKEQLAIIQSKDIDVLGLSVRTYNCLKRAGIITVGDLEKLTTNQLKNVRNLGEQRFNEVIGVLKGNGIALQDEKDLAAIRAIEIDDLSFGGELSVRSYNCLKRAGLKTIGDIEKLSPRELKRIRNFGKHSYDEVKSVLEKYGITL